MSVVTEFPRKIGRHTLDPGELLNRMLSICLFRFAAFTIHGVRWIVLYSRAARMRDGRQWIWITGCKPITLLLLMYSTKCAYSIVCAVAGSRPHPSDAIRTFCLVIFILHGWLCEAKMHTDVNCPAIFCAHVDASQANPSIRDEEHSFFFVRFLFFFSVRFCYCCCCYAWKWPL